jgi:threonine dehydrogenase-like Zn-dependent dehydrogenase
MKAITFAAPIPTYLLTLAAGAVSKRLLVGRHACTRYGEVARPDIPGPDWVRVRTRLGGICGSDLAVVSLQASPATSPFSSFPFVLGHENVGTIEEVGSAVRGFAVGQRVVVNPLLSCEPRAVDPPCAACRSGRPSRCEHFTDGAVPAGMLIGTTRGLGGSWGESFVAHQGQVREVPAAVSDEAAVLVEPFACSVHAVRGAWPAVGERVLVIGAGSIGLLTAAALRAIAPEAAVTVLARHDFQREQALRLGAARVVMGRGRYLDGLAEAAGARLLSTLVGPPATVGGFDRAFVCIGGPRGMDDALRFTRAGGDVVLLGNARALDGLDWTPLWLKELTLRGSLTYGRGGDASGPAHGGAANDDFDLALELIASGRAPVAPLVTHVFPLAEHARALATAMGKGASRSVKVAFRC